MSSSDECMIQRMPPITASNPGGSDDSPIVNWQKSGRAPPVDAEIQQPVGAFDAAQQTIRHRKAARRFQDQAKEDHKGKSVSGSENSSDDPDQLNLSNGLSGSDHLNASRPDYLGSLGSQCNFPSPLHKKRYSGMMPLVGASFDARRNLIILNSY
jgi:hypothetical protein